jgi:hypothetical protein
LGGVRFFAISRRMVTRAPARSEETSTGEWQSPAGRPTPAAPHASDEALARLALDYATRSVRFINARSADQISDWPVDLRPTPAETVLWFHSRIYFKTMRALVGKALTAAAAADRFEDPRVCARQTLIAIARSRAALTHLRVDDVERTALVELLDEIALGIEERFACGRPFGRALTSRLPAGGCASSRVAPDQSGPRAGALGTKKKPASLLKRAARRETP